VNLRKDHYRIVKSKSDPIWGFLVYA